MNPPNKTTYFDASIFIIDDEPIATEVIKLHLADGGYKNLYVFNHSVEAIETLSFVKVDLIISDINMPELGGKFLTKLARKTSHLKDTPIIIVSSDTSDATRNHLFGNGISEILYKPVEQVELLGHVEAALAQAHADKAVATEMRQKDRQREKLVRSSFNR